MLCMPVPAQRLAIITPDYAEPSARVAAVFAGALSDKVPLIDPSLASAAYSSEHYADPFNLTVEESKKIGAAIGCDFFMLLKAGSHRRSAFGRKEYYESYVALYLVSSRTGRLVFWTLMSSERPKPDEAEQALVNGTRAIADHIAHVAQTTSKREINEKPKPRMEELPDVRTPASPGLRAPVPYRRIKPVYTAQAAFYDVKATVDIVVDLGADGAVLRTEIVRWAGFGLDESVERAVREMTWRPADRNGKSLPMRVLLRYNFKRIDKEQP